MPKIIEIGSKASANLTWKIPKLKGAKKITPTAYKAEKIAVNEIIFDFLFKSILPDFLR
jgi:hypothetical protein